MNVHMLLRIVIVLVCTSTICIRTSTIIHVTTDTAKKNFSHPSLSQHPSDSHHLSFFPSLEAKKKKAFFPLLVVYINFVSVFFLLFFFGCIVGI